MQAHDNLYLDALIKKNSNKKINQTKKQKINASTNKEIQLYNNLE